MDAPQPLLATRLPALRLPALHLPALLAALTLSLLAAPAPAQQEAGFTVLPDVVAPRPEAFTATIMEFGNGSRLTPDGGFEPTVFRTMLLATEDADNRIIAMPETLSAWDSWTNGTFDEADVEVLRIDNGKFVSVRSDRVPEGGYHASGWNPLGSKPVPATQTEFLSGWDAYNRKDAPYYYTVRAVDRRGRLSPPAEAVQLVSPAKSGNAPAPESLDMKLSDRSSRLPAPAGLQAQLVDDGIARLTWDPVPGARGYMVYRADQPPEQHEGYAIDLQGQGPAIRAGDLVLLRKRILEPDRTRLVSNRFWDTGQARSNFIPSLLPDFPGVPDVPHWRLVPHEEGTSVSEPGETFLQADLRPGQELKLGGYNYSGIDQSYYEVLDPDQTYRFEVWMRAKDQVSASFTLEGLYNAKLLVGLPAQVQPTAEWQKFSADFRVPELRDGKQVGRMTLNISGQGQVDIDNLRVYRSDAPFLSMLPEDAKALRDSGMSALRTHSFIKLGKRTYDLAQLTNPGGLSGVNGGNTLPQTLAAIEAVGMEPWLQIQPHFSRDEWLGLAEYLAAPAPAAGEDPAARPWAAKRAAQGHPDPYAGKFARMRFEIGNETWNGLFAPWVFPEMRDAATGASYTTGEVYGLYQEYVLSILAQSPWWPDLAPHLQPVLGGWAISDYGFDAAKLSPGSQAVTHAEYIGGWDSGEGPVAQTPESYASVLAFAPQVAMPRAQELQDRLDKMPARAGALQLGTYESGPGYALNGLNNEKVTPEQAAIQEQVMKSAAAGTATLDSFLAQIRAGYSIQNYFTFGRGNYWTSHAQWHHGGQAYPAWSWLALANRELLGDMLEVETRQVPLGDLPENRRRKAMTGVPLVDLYAFRRDDRLSVIAVSRRVPDLPPGQDGHTALQVDLPISGAAKLTRYSMTGDYRSENTRSDAARIVTEDLPVPAAPGRLEIADLPPGATQVYVFDGISGLP